jgi:hypothetical protein
MMRLWWGLSGEERKKKREEGEGRGRVLLNTKLSSKFKKGATLI